jgi:hypothetical protein
MAGFDVLELSPGRWQMRNVTTHVTHVTYGTRAEVEQRAKRGTDALNRIFGASKRHGSAWRNLKIR